MAAGDAALERAVSTRYTRTALGTATLAQVRAGGRDPAVPRSPFVAPLHPPRRGIDNAIAARYYFKRGTPTGGVGITKGAT